MAKIKLTEGYTPIPEGPHIFKITKSTYDEDYGKLEVELVTAEGMKHTERYSLINDLGEINEGANKAFSFFAKTALNNFNLEEIDTDDIVGCYVEANVKHDIQPSTKDPVKNVTFIQLKDLKPASGFKATENTDSAPVENKPSGKTDTATKASDIDLDALLGL